MNLAKKYRYKRNQKNLPLIRLSIFIGAIVLLFFTLGIITTNFSSDVSENKEGIFTSREEQFINQLSPHAREMQSEYGVLPSVTIAQAILESNWGRSELAQEDNNYYGIKGNENTNEYATREYTDQWVEINASFRSYDSPADSMADYSRLLANGTAWDKNHYNGVVEADNYKEAAYALQEAGYATDPGYAEKVISLVEKYNLNQYDG